MNRGANIETVSGRTLVTVSGAVTTPISPASFPRAAAMADVFQFYRFVDLKVTILPGSTGGHTTGFAPGSGFDTAPTSTAQILELPFAAISPASKTVDTVFKVPRKELLRDTQLPWFKTIAGTPDAQFEIQGNLYSVSTAGLFIVDWRVEFQSWNLAGQSPLLKGNISSSLSTPKPTSGRIRALRGSDDIVDSNASNNNANASVVVIDGMTYYKSSA